MKVRVAICDNERLNTDILRQILQNFNEIEIVGEAFTGEDCIKLINHTTPDILFCEIKLPSINGIETALILRDRFPDLYIVFMSSYSEYVLESFNARPFDYIMKPFDSKKVYMTISALLKQIKQKKKAKPTLSTSLILNFDDEIHIIPQEEIVFITRESGVSVIFTDKSKYFSYESLEAISLRLNRHVFVRSHKSYIINKNKVEKMVINNKTSYKVLFKGYRDFAYILSSKVKEIKLKLAF
ncbi:MAG: LytTR family DNA-binding domain-containing protein [Clostridia bacterium]|nr:LytTR family DNA-binding domain-containing protein [Clostridia bacterium]